MKTLGLFCGGYSSEYEISLKSARTILQHFPKEINVYLIEVKEEGFELIFGEKKLFFSLDTMSAQDDDTAIKIDAALIYIHGNPGENGKLQAVFDLKNIAYLNSSVLASSLSFDKWYCNQFLARFDIPVAKSELLLKGQKIDEKELLAQLGLPCFVKPTDSGSSFGISKVSTQEQFSPALELAFKEGDSVVVESFLSGIEVTCAVYHTKDGLQTLPITEIVSENDFFDYEAKYNGKSKEITPARISAQEAEDIRTIAQKCYQLLQLRSVARIDFMLVNSKPHVIEVNTTPGFSPASIVPQMLSCAGISIQEFWQSIVEKELPQLLQ